MSSRVLVGAAALSLALLANPPAARGAADSLLAVTASGPAGTTLLTRDEALKLAFPRCEVKRTTVYLDDVQRKRIASLAKVEFEGSVIYPYVATSKTKGELVGTAYFDAHRVRTKRETLMVVVAPDGKIRRVEVLAFAEPKEYLPRGKWYEQFKGRLLDEDLSLKRKIRGVTGATLTAKATAAAARRILAVHQVLAEIEKKKREDEKKRKEAERRKRGDSTPPDRTGG